MVSSRVAGAISQRFAYILAGIGQGMSGNKIIQTLRDAGLGLRRSTALSLISTARDYYNKRVTTAGLDYNNPVPASAVSPWASKTKTGYGHAVSVYLRDIGTGNVVQKYFTAYSQTLLTPGEAVAAALSAYGDQAEVYRQTMMGGVLTNVVQYTPSEI
jgi:hypothetical protein